MHMARIGYCRTRKELRLIVKKILDKDGRENPFKNNMPGQSWMRSFLRRHPKISIRQSSSLPYSRAQGCTKEILDEWYDGFRQQRIEREEKKKMRDRKRYEELERKEQTRKERKGLAKEEAKRLKRQKTKMGKKNMEWITCIGCGAPEVDDDDRAWV